MNLCIVSYKKQLALSSRTFNARDKIFRELFPELCQNLPAEGKESESTTGSQQKEEDPHDFLGSDVRIQGLQSKEWNDLQGVATAYDKVSQRYTIMIEKKGAVKIKPANLRALVPRTGGTSTTGVEGQAQSPAGAAGKKTKKIKPNEPCPCGKGNKYKKCCGR